VRALSVSEYSASRAAGTEEAADRNCNWLQKEIRLEVDRTPKSLRLHPYAGLGLRAAARTRSERPTGYEKKNPRGAAYFN